MIIFEINFLIMSVMMFNQNKKVINNATFVIRLMMFGFSLMSIFIYVIVSMTILISLLITIFSSIQILFNYQFYSKYQV